MPPKHCKCKQWQWLAGGASRLKALALIKVASFCRMKLPRVIPISFPQKAGIYYINRPTKFLTSLHLCACPHLAVLQHLAKTNTFSVGLREILFFLLLILNMIIYHFHIIYYDYFFY